MNQKENAPIFFSNSNFMAAIKITREVSKKDFISNWTPTERRNDSFAQGRLKFHKKSNLAYFEIEIAEVMLPYIIMPRHDHEVIKTSESGERFSDFMERHVPTILDETKTGECLTRTRWQIENFNRQSDQPVLRGVFM